MTRNFVRRRNANAEAEPKAREFDNPEDRDLFLEAQFRFDRKGYASTLAYVGGEQDELVRLFHESWEGIEDAKPALIRFEVAHFGSALDRVAHGTLSFAVRRSMREGLPPARRAKLLPRNIGEDALDYIGRIAVANGWARPGAEPVKEMPEAHPSGEVER